MRRVLNPTVVALVGLVVLLASVILFDQFGQDRDERDRHDAEVQIVHMQRASCERIKLDRADNAAGWAAHRTYLEGIARAASVRKDVRSAARRAATTYRRVVASLTRRSRINCRAVFPMP